MPTNSMARSQIAARMSLPVIRQAPMKHSSVAMATRLTAPGIRPKVSRCVVALVRPSAGLMPGKYFRTPKPRNTAPTATRSTATLWATSW